MTEDRPGGRKTNLISVDRRNPDLRVQASRCNTELEVPRIEAPEPPPAPDCDGEPNEDEPVIVINTDASPLYPSPADPWLLTVRLLTVGIAVLALLDVVPVIVAARQSWGEASQWVHAHMFWSRGLWTSLS